MSRGIRLAHDLRTTVTSRLEYFGITWTLTSKNERDENLPQKTKYGHMTSHGINSNLHDGPLLILPISNILLDCGWCLQLHFLEINTTDGNPVILLSFKLRVVVRVAGKPQIFSVNFELLSVGHIPLRLSFSPQVLSR